MFKLKRSEHKTVAAWYSKYLLSSEWTAKRRRLIQEADGYCTRTSQDGFRCNHNESRHGLTIHHLTYIDVTNELDTQLQVLCEACHREAHTYNIKVGILVPFIWVIYDENGLESLRRFKEWEKNRCE